MNIKKTYYINVIINIINNYILILIALNNVEFFFKNKNDIIKNGKK